MEVSREVARRALEALDRFAAQTVVAISLTADPDTAAHLSERLNTLDTGKILVTEVLQRSGSSTHI